MTLLGDTTPYPWPWDAALRAERVALLIMDAAEEGTQESPSPAGERLGELAEELSAHGGMVVWVRCGISPGATATAGLSAADRVIGTPGLDGFYDSPLDSLLRREGRDLLVLAGRWLETTVHSTMRSANDRGYECLLLEDLSESADRALQPGAISSIHMSGGIFGATAQSDELRRWLLAINDRNNMKGERHVH